MCFCYRFDLCHLRGKKIRIGSFEPRSDGQLQPEKEGKESPKTAPTGRSGGENINYTIH